MALFEVTSERIDPAAAATAGLTYAAATYLGDMAVEKFFLPTTPLTDKWEMKKVMMEEAVAAGLIAGLASSTSQFSSIYHNQSMSQVAMKAAGGSLAGGFFLNEQGLGPGKCDQDILGISGLL